jgi:predicted DCC family thiol-disulfide oxidoreductase YuxK
MRPARTTGPGRYVVLYDGFCAFCASQKDRLVRLGKPGVVEARDFQADGVLDAFPGITYDDAMREMLLITPEGRVFGGAEAIARTLLTRPIFALVVFLYFVPGLRALFDAAYRALAARRYRLFAAHSGGCENGVCSLHRPHA